MKDIESERDELKDLEDRSQRRISALSASVDKWSRTFVDYEKRVESERAALQAMLTILNEKFSITEYFICNGCEHGFKPSSSCPNESCTDKKAHEIWNRLYKESTT